MYKHIPKPTQCKTNVRNWEFLTAFKLSYDLNTFRLYDKPQRKTFVYNVTFFVVLCYLLKTVSLNKLKVELNLTLLSC